MSWKHFAPVPQEATLSFGGYSFIHPQAWKEYLDKVIREDYPDYFVEHLNGFWRDFRWRKQESCILTSLEEYLFHEFGVCIPEDNLFKVYNKEGQGLDLTSVIDAISGVIEPLGFEIYRVLAVDPEIRSTLGDSDKVIGEKQGKLVEGKPGLCMINVGNGFSHAFYWKNIDRRGFRHEKFRMVVLINKRAEDVQTTRSAAQSLNSYLQFFKEVVQSEGVQSGSSLETNFAEIEELENICTALGESWDPETRANIDKHLATLLEKYQVFMSKRSREGQQNEEGLQVLLEAGQMVRKVVREGTGSR
jgi:hypothetical protein